MGQCPFKQPTSSLESLQFLSQALKFSRTQGCSKSSSCPGNVLTFVSNPCRALSGSAPLAADIPRRPLTAAPFAGPQLFPASLQFPRGGVVVVTRQADQARLSLVSGPHPAQGSQDAWTEESRGPPLDRKAPGNEKVTGNVVEGRGEVLCPRS